MKSNKSKGAKVYPGGRVHVWAVITQSGIGKISPFSATQTIEDTEEEIEEDLDGLTGFIMVKFGLKTPSPAKVFVSFSGDEIKLEAFQDWMLEDPSKAPEFTEWLKRVGLYKEQR